MKSILAAILFLSVVQVQAGPSTSGGGGAFVCRDTQGQVTSSELLDLWEAKNLLGWNVEYKKETVDKKIDKAIARLSEIDSKLSDLVKTELLKIRAEVFYLPAAVALTAPVDANHIFTKPGCPLEGMLYYDSKRSPKPGLFVDNNIFKKLMTPTDTAASWMHEAVYKVYRDHYKASDSVNSRKITGCLFSSGWPCLENSPMGLSVTPVAGKNIFKCESTDEKLVFKAYQVKGIGGFDNWVLAIHQLGERFFSKPIYSRGLGSHEAPERPRPIDTILFSQNLKSGISWSGYKYDGSFPSIMLTKVDSLDNPTQVKVVISHWSSKEYQGEGDAVYYSYRTIPCKINK